MSNDKPPKGNWQSVCIHNQTGIPMVYVISQLSPLYWGVLQPNEKVQQKTGRFHFTVTAFPHNGENEPDIASVIKSHMSDITMIGGGLFAILGFLTGSKNVNSMAMSLGAAAAGTAVGKAINSCIGNTSFGEFERDSAFWVGKIRGHLADGTWLHILGGPIEDSAPYRVFLSVFPYPVFPEDEVNGKKPPWVMDLSKAGVMKKADGANTVMLRL